MYRIALLIIIFLYSCSNKPVATGEEAFNGVKVRYKNISSDTFRLLQTETAAGKKYIFENILPGQLTDFVTVPVAYASHYAKVITPTDSFIFEPVGLAGEETFNAGYLTLALNIVKNEVGQRQLAFAGDDASSYTDYRAADADIIDNLFTSINSQDWRTVNSYYTANTIITDEGNNGFKGAPAEYFQRLFTVNGIKRISVVEQQASNDAVYVMALTSRGAYGAEAPICISFVIQNNQIIEQHMVLCDQ